MLILRIYKKTIFFLENYFFFFKNLIRIDYYFAIRYFKINIYFLKTDWKNTKKIIIQLYDKKYLDKIESDYKANNLKLTNKNYYPELFSLYLYYRFNNNFKNTFLLKQFLLNNNYLNSKKYNFQKNFELQKYDKINLNDELESICKKNIKKNSNKIFIKYLTGKKIALVGPNTSAKYIGNEIDNFDIVIRTNYRFGSNKPFEIYGSKTNISYYNSFRISIMENVIKKNQNNLDWMVFKSNNDIKKLNLSFSNNTRVSNDPKNFFLFSSPMSPQRIIFDILTFKPKYFKIFHFDLYNSGFYNSDYKDWDLNNKAISNSLREHGAYSCFIFMKNFFNLNLFEADVDTENVLKLSSLQYAENLDKRFGKLKHSDEY
jgi:hypothetical protein